MSARTWSLLASLIWLFQSTAASAQDQDPFAGRKRSLASTVKQIVWDHIEAPKLKKPFEDEKERIESLRSRIESAAKLIEEGKRIDFVQGHMEPESFVLHAVKSNMTAEEYYNQSFRHAEKLASALRLMLSSDPTFLLEGRVAYFSKPTRLNCWVFVDGTWKVRL